MPQSNTDYDQILPTYTSIYPYCQYMVLLTGGWRNAIFGFLNREVGSSVPSWVIHRIHGVGAVHTLLEDLLGHSYPLVYSALKREVISMRRMSIHAGLWLYLYHPKPHVKSIWYVLVKW